MRRWYEYEYKTEHGNEKWYHFIDQDEQCLRMGVLVDSPPIEWMQLVSKNNVKKIRELLEENESMANLLTEHYSEKT